MSDVSQASISPSPAIKIAHTVNKSTVDDMDTMEQLTNMCLDAKDETEASLHTKLDMVIHLLQEMKNDFDSQKTSTTKEIESVKMENQWLKLKLKESEGKITRTNSQVASLKSKCEDLEFRAMKTNIVIYNVPEKQIEDIYNVIEDLLANKLRMPDDLIHSCRHPGALVQIDVAHRIGKPGAKPRPIVVKLVTQRGKDIIFAHV